MNEKGLGRLGGGSREVTQKVDVDERRSVRVAKTWLSPVCILKTDPIKKIRGKKEAISCHSSN